MPPLEQLLAKRQITLTRFAGLSLVLDARAAMYCPAQQCLVVSDLHLQKGSYLRRHANPIPVYDCLDTLRRLETLIDCYQPQRLVCLGDSFHDLQAFERMQGDEWQLLQRLFGRVTNWQWVLGNHDPALSEKVPGEGVTQSTLGSALLSHEPVPGQAAQIIGHYHPKTRVEAQRKRYSGRCFVATEQVMVMPAFGSYTGGLDTQDDAFLPVLGKATRRHYLIHNQKIWSVTP